MEPVHILLGVTGSVAVVKTPALAAALRTAVAGSGGGGGRACEIRVVYTDAATRFGDATANYAASKGHDGRLFVPGTGAGVGADGVGFMVVTDSDEWDNYAEVGEDAVLHVELAKWADVLVVAPLSANTLAKLAAGLCDNLLTCVARAWDRGAKPVVFAPAMNTRMWVHPFTTKHLAAVADNFGPTAFVVPPKSNYKLACGDVGAGALADVGDIAAAAVAALGTTATASVPAPAPAAAAPPSSNFNFNSNYNSNSNSNSNSAAAPAAPAPSSNAGDAAAKAMAAARRYFEETPPPPGLADAAARLDAFLARNAATRRRVVLVSSGGTSVPLERNTVRTIENFSTGSRGAACVEHFLRQGGGGGGGAGGGDCALDAGYAVVLLVRRGAVMPFARHWHRAVSRHTDFAFLDAIPPSSADNGFVTFAAAAGANGGGFAAFNEALALYRRAQDEGRLLVLEFEALASYMFQLRAACGALARAGLGPRAMVFLAAAVSDFHVPHAKMARHKIQSAAKERGAPAGSAGGLTLTLENVPKMLYLVRRAWCPGAFCVSFKLETDVAILVRKARGAIEKYGVHLVVANELHSRYRELHLVAGAGADAAPPQKITRDGVEIEAPLVAAVAARHREFMGGVAAPAGGAVGNGSGGGGIWDVDGGGDSSGAAPNALDVIGQSWHEKYFHG